MKKILLIDDDDSMRLLLERVLKRAGYEVTSCDDGRKGLKEIRRAGSFDLIVTDIVMPEVEGIDVILQVRQENPDIPVVAISGGGRNSPHTYLQMAVKLGANVMLAKPFSNEELLLAVEGQLAAAA